MCVVLHREAVYLAGGALSVTPRVLVVDLLLRKLPAHLVRAVIVCNAHSVTQSSLEAFALELMHRGNAAAETYAVTDRADLLRRSLLSLQRTLQLLHCSEAMLYPRYAWGSSAAAVANSCGVGKR